MGHGAGTKTTHLLRSNWILGDPPAVTEAIGQFKDGQNELALGGTALLEPGLQREVFDVGGIGRGCREVVDGLGGIRLATPPVPGFVVSL
jgi:hypothetical protein